MSFKEALDKFIREDMAIANENFGREVISNTVDVINFMAEYLEKKEPNATNDIARLKSVGVLIDLYTLIYTEGE